MNDELCMCMSVIAHQQEPESYQWSGSVLWGVWQECQEHHEHFVSPVWHPRLGQLKYEPATVGAAPAELEVVL